MVQKDIDKIIEDFYSHFEGRIFHEGYTLDFSADDLTNWLKDKLQNLTK